MDRKPVEEQVKRVDSAPNPSSMTVISCIPARARAFYRAGPAGSPPPSSWFEIRLFYVRISPFTADVAPENLTLSHLRRESGVVLEINGSRVAPSEPTSVVLRRDRVDRGAAEVTFVSTDSVRFTGAVDFEVYRGKELLLCGSLERLETPWTNGVEQQHPTPQTASVKDPKTGWCMNCYLAESPSVQPKLSTMPPSIEVYVAGCSSGYPLILAQTIQHSPRRKKALIHGVLDAIPEGDETSGKEYGTAGSELTLQRLSMVEEDETDEVETSIKVGHSLYPSSGYYEYDDGGELSWFNAGVRVGMGLGLGMCLGIGLGVGILMRSYQATTRTFRRRLL